MIESLEALGAQERALYDPIIDVRSPAEFADDHVPGAINLPVLDDEERRLIGEIYVQQSKFTARRLGAALAARNIAGHLEAYFADKDGGCRPAVYCWRGGQRSAAMATILSQVGFRTALLRGGYKTYRRRVVERLYGADFPGSVVVLGGGTGSAKTPILALVAARGGQTIDLEALADHRGSLFGGLKNRPQPSQRLFESRLAAAIEALDPSRPTLVEAESSRIGRLTLPTSLWRGMRQAARIEIDAPAATRARHIARTYQDLALDVDAQLAAIDKLPPHLGSEARDTFRRLALQGEAEALASALIQSHYDPAYRRSSRRDARPPAALVSLPALEAADLESAAEQICRLLPALQRATEALVSCQPPAGAPSSEPRDGREGECGDTSSGL